MYSANPGLFFLSIAERCSRAAGASIQQEGKGAAITLAVWLNMEEKATLTW